MSAPQLGPHCGSWVIVERATGRAVLETWDRAQADKISTRYAATHEVLTAMSWLQRVNAQVKAGQS